MAVFSHPASTGVTYLLRREASTYFINCILADYTINDMVMHNGLGIKLWEIDVKSRV